MPLVPQELRDVAPGLWIWRLEHPEWRAGLDWPPAVTSTCVESGGEGALLDALAPPEDAAEVWARLDARPPTMVVVLKPDHVRDAALAAGAAGARVRGRADRAGRPAPHLGHAVARGARAACAAQAARAPVRARDRRPRRAGARPSGVRARPRATTLGGLRRPCKDRPRDDRDAIHRAAR